MGGFLLGCAHYSAFGAIVKQKYRTPASYLITAFICIIRPAQYFQTADRGKVVARFLIQFAHIIGMFLRQDDMFQPNETGRARVLFMHFLHLRGPFQDSSYQMGNRPRRNAVFTGKIFLLTAVLIPAGTVGTTTQFWSNLQNSYESKAQRSNEPVLS